MKQENTGRFVDVRRSVRRGEATHLSGEVRDRISKALELLISLDKEIETECVHGGGRA